MNIKFKSFDEFINEGDITINLPTEIPTGKIPPRNEEEKFMEFVKIYSDLKMDHKDLQKLRGMDKEYGEIYSIRNLDWHRKILNEKEEAEKFFKHLEEGKRYNPIFEHNPEMFTKNGMIKKAKDLRDRFKLFDCYLSLFYVERLDFLIQYGEAMLMNKDSQEYANSIVKIFPPPAKNLISEAEKIVDENPYEKVEKSERSIDAKEMKTKIEGALKDLGYERWKVKIVDTITPRMNVKDEYIVNINKNSKFSEDDFKGLVEHEIKGHVGRRWYGDKTGLILFRNGIMGKNQFDEGLAIYNSLFKVETPKPNILFNISFMTIMTGQLQNLDFFDLFQFGKKYMADSDKKLFAKLARMKRMCHDTSVLIGDFYEKDYLDGYLRVSKMNDKEREEIKKFNIGPNNYHQLDHIKAFLTINGFISEIF
jgi:hypothetical protein